MKEESRKSEMEEDRLFLKKRLICLALAEIYKEMANVGYRPYLIEEAEEMSGKLKEYIFQIYNKRLNIEP
nr:hypothetical protein [Fusobacterium gastrosuis]